ncbi:hypothetical protein CUT44_24055 [Streptomyces carminius]|uniref:SGNH hydrolase-type esterase domain-containing protein n=1 Tax=Streptomyces carminius TaxID=2665496 RepID=A0A2M8LU05_9ACTN|nr:hypothetical protein CUT44_24055 [Streptomyces carminius]
MPSSVVTRRVTKLRPGLVTTVSACSIRMACPSGVVREGPTGDRTRRGAARCHRTGRGVITPRLPPGRQLAVANAGISGNTVSRQPNPYDPTGRCCGPPVPERLEYDALDLAGARHLILLEGTNDLGGGDHAPPAPASRVIGAMKEIVERAHARGVKIVGATLMPMCAAADSGTEANRRAVNEFIRTGGVFDGVADFDAVVRDPADPTRIREAYRSDCYHPNAAGHAALGKSLDLGLFGLDRPRVERAA